MIYENINNGVYRAGFAKSQQAYEDAATNVFKAWTRWKPTLRIIATLPVTI